MNGVKPRGHVDLMQNGKNTHTRNLMRVTCESPTVTLLCSAGQDTPFLLQPQLQAGQHAQGPTAKCRTQGDEVHLVFVC